MAKGSKSDRKTTKPSAAAPAERAAKQFQKTVAPLAKAAATPAKVDKKAKNKSKAPLATPSKAANGKPSKAPPKPVEPDSSESSSDADSSDEEEAQIAKKSPTVTPQSTLRSTSSPGKRESSSSGDSSDSSDSSDSDSSSDSDEIEEKVSKKAPAPQVNGKAASRAKVAPTKAPSKKAPPAPKVESVDLDSSSDNDSESEEEKPKAVQVKATPVAKSKKKDESSDSDSSSSSSSSSSDDSDESDATVHAKPVLAKSGSPPKPPASKDSSEESSDDSSESDEAAEPAPSAKGVNGKRAAAPVKAVALGDSSSDSDTSSESDSESSSDTESSSDSSDEESDVEMADATEKSKPPATLSKKRKAEDEVKPPAKKFKAEEGVEERNLFVGQLSWNIDDEWLKTAFADCGPVERASVQMDRQSGRSRGFGYVLFATSDAAKKAAAEMNGKEIDGRAIKVDFATERTPNPAARAKQFGDTPAEPTHTLFVGNVSFDATEDAVWELFSEYGDVVNVRLPTDRETGAMKGFAYVEFSNVESAKKAYEGAAGGEIGGRYFRLDYSHPREAVPGSGGNRARGGRGFSDRGGRGGGRGGFGGGFGGRGGFSDRGRGGFGGRGGFSDRGGGGRGRGGYDRGGRGRGGRGDGGNVRTGGAASFQGRKVTFT